MNFKTRPAKLNDLPQILNLIKELAIFEKEPNGVIITLDDLVRDFNDNLFDCLIAENDVHEILGMALFYYRYSTWKGKTIHLEDLIVQKKFRSLGVGKALLDEVISKAKKENLNRVEWVVLDWNTNAISFYEKVGAKVLKDWYVVQLDKNGITNY